MQQKLVGSLWQYYKDLSSDSTIDSESFKYKVRITGSTPVAGNTTNLEKLAHWNTQAQNQYMKYLIISSLEGVSRLSVLSFKSNTGRIGQVRRFLSTVEMKDYNVMVSGQNVLDQPVKKWSKNVQEQPKDYNW